MDIIGYYNKLYYFIKQVNLEEFLERKIGNFNSIIELSLAVGH